VAGADLVSVGSLFTISLVWLIAGTEGGIGVDGNGGCVERRLAHCWLRWPLIMAANWGGCLWTWADVSWGHVVVMRLASMASHQVERGRVLNFCQQRF
jgi:hypothetical protein